MQAAEGKEGIESADTTAEDGEAHDEATTDDPPPPELTKEASKAELNLNSKENKTQAKKVAKQGPASKGKRRNSFDSPRWLHNLDTLIGGLGPGAKPRQRRLSGSDMTPREAWAAEQAAGAAARVTAPGTVNTSTWSIKAERSEAHADSGDLDTIRDRLMGRKLFGMCPACCGGGFGRVWTRGGVCWDE
jgi:hypothetical protein